MEAGTCQVSWNAINHYLHAWVCVCVCVCVFVWSVVGNRPIFKFERVLVISCRAQRFVCHGQADSGCCTALTTFRELLVDQVRNEETKSVPNGNGNGMLFVAEGQPQQGGEPSKNMGGGARMALTSRGWRQLWSMSIEGCWRLLWFVPPEAERQVGHWHDGHTPRSPRFWIGLPCAICGLRTQCRLYCSSPLYYMLNARSLRNHSQLSPNSKTIHRFVLACRWNRLGKDKWFI